MQRLSSLIRAGVMAAAIAGLAQSLGAQGATTVTPRVRTDSVRPNIVYGTVDGIVTDTNLVPLRGAFVSILSSKIRVGTGPNGRFRITKVPAGEYLLIVTRVGYTPTSAVVEVPASDTLRLSYTLGPGVVTLAAVGVTAERPASSRLRGFYERQKVGLGEFMNTEEIEKRNSVFATELFRKFGSINVSPSHTKANAEYFPLSKREGGNPSMGACPMMVYLDQIPLPTPFNLDLLPSPKEIAGIEVYAGSATIPPQFNGFNRGCGVILVWTKDGY
ncbi:MAG: hypothetical protein JWM95_4704 [Gemmatimonadetes bacterium]|nr:hypothetical protein [Gemmatimonadota bacterium]